MKLKNWNLNCIKKMYQIIFLTITLFYTYAKAVGEGAVITLEFPAGAENTALGETGVSYANTIYSVFWNPANVACLYEETYLNHIYSNFHEDLLPLFNIPDLYHNFYAFSITFNDIFPHIDIGYAYFNNFINFGENYQFDSNGIVIDTFYSDETVYANCFGVRVFDIFSLGVNIKSYDSRLAPGMGDTLYPNDGTAQGHAFDIGLRVNKKFYFLDLIYINPAIGISALNMGNDSTKYIDTSDNKDPLPRKGIVGGSCKFNALEFFEYSFIYEVDYNLLSKPHEKTKHIGHKIQITPFYALLRGKMDDPAGSRYEDYEGYTLSFNFVKTLHMVSKVVKLFDYINKKNNYDKFTKMESKFTYAGFKFKPNLYISKSHSVIHDRKPGQIREGQTRDDWSIGLGIISGFPNLFKKNENQSKTDTEKKFQLKNHNKNTNDSLIINEEDGQIVE